MRRRVPLPSLAVALLLAAGSACPSHATATRGFILGTDYTSGTLGVADLDTRTVTRDVAVLSGDPVARWYDGLLYVVNRLGYDNVQVIAPASGYATLRQFSVGSGTNPQDIAFASATRAYVSRLGSPDLLVVNPGTGASLGTIPLGAWADADGNPEAAHMIVHGDLLFVALERLTNFAPADTGLVVVVDTRADTVFDADPLTAGTQVVRLPGMNPSTDFARLGGATPADSAVLLVGCTGQWGVADGGIARIVVPGGARDGMAPIVCTGYAITESALGGDAADVAADTSARAYAIVGDAAYNTSLVAWDPVTGTKRATLYDPGGYCLSDVALDDRGGLYACNSGFDAPGLEVFATATGDHLAGPLATGLPPVQIVFDLGGGGADGPGPLGLALGPAKPNPARGSVCFDLTLAGPGLVQVEIFDLVGRRVRVLARDEFPSGTTPLVWDLRDSGSRSVPPGVYLARATALGAAVARRVVVLD